MVAKKARYQPFGDELSVEAAYLQAANVLDVAAEIAIRREEVERLETISALWMELGKRLIEGSGGADDDDDVDEEIEQMNRPQVVGFGKEQNERVE